MIRFLKAKNVPPATIHRQLVKVYEEGGINKGMRTSGVICLMGEGQM
jgi:hypothetical protein